MNDIPITPAEAAALVDADKQQRGAEAAGAYTLEEISALAMLLNRAPLNQAEVLWVQALFAKLSSSVTPAPQVEP